MGMFEIGGRVVCVVDHPDGNEDLIVGCTGTVCEIRSNVVGVRWDNEIWRGHNCGSKCDNGHGWRVKFFEIEPEEDYNEPFEFDEEAFQALLLSH